MNQRLRKMLGLKCFRSLFPVILTDNGVEFQNSFSLENTWDGQSRTKIYYCNPHSSWQKGSIEKNHEYIRMIVPKGKPFDNYTRNTITLMINHTNSEARDSLNGCTPFKLSLLLLNNQLHQVLSLQEIAPDEVIINPKLI